eukprot:s4367_g3.t1
MEVKAAMAAAAEFAWSNAALQYQDIFQELGVKDKLPQRGGRAAVMQETDKQAGQQAKLMSCVKFHSVSR